jgi:hypothetical protein
VWVLEPLSYDDFSGMKRREKESQEKTINGNKNKNKIKTKTGKRKVLKVLRTKDKI